MKKAILGMKTLNITQGYDIGTHKGTNALDLAGEDTGRDVWRSKCYWKCLNIKPYSTTGFANTCFFGTCDADGNMIKVNTPARGDLVLTLALTHDLKIRVEVGKVYEGDQIIYMEGTTGQATGNHIHTEVCEGWVTEKVKNSAGYWSLPKTLPIHECLYLMEGYNVVKNDGGYLWTWTASVETEEKKIPFGLSQHEISGCPVYLYKLDKKKTTITQRENEKPITLKTAVGGKRLTSSYTFDRHVPSYIYVKNIETGDPIFAMPYCYFEDHKTYANYGQIYGRCQGENVNRAPDQYGYLDTVIDTDFNMIQGDHESQMASWEHLDDYLIGVSSALVLYREGVPRKLYSDAVGWGKYTTPKTQTILAQDSESILIGVVDGNILPQTVADWLHDFGCQKVEFGDSGGSAYAYYLEGNDPLVNKVGWYSPSQIGIKILEVPCKLLRSPVDGEVVETVDIGNYLTLKEISEKELKDGYKWAKVDSYVNHDLYAQINFSRMRFEV